jgi:glutamate 5-kinase
VGKTAQRIRDARRIVVKIGSAVLAGPGAGRFDRPVMAGLARQMAALREDRREVVVVSSGAILAGSAVLGVALPARSLGDKQALAAIGQVELMNRWRDIFGWYDLRVAQILLTRDDLADRDRFLNARRTLGRLLAHGVVPIINENDTVVVEEIKLGDNDNLSALVTNLVTADLLVILTEVDGVYTADPRTHRSAKLLPRIEAVTDEVLAIAGDAGPAGRGGMRTKLLAARTAGAFGVPTVIAPGRAPRVLKRIIEGEALGTVVRPSDKRMDSHKHWLAFAPAPAGTLVLDAGAARAIREGGKSLLPSGIAAVRGDFEAGDAVEMVSPDGAVVGRGIAAYGSTEIAKIRGRKSAEIEKILGYTTADEVVHRDRMVVDERMWRTK